MSGNQIGEIEPPLVEYEKDFETVMTCSIYQYEGWDSINKTLSQIIKYGKDFQILSKQYQGHKTTLYISSANVIEYFDYKGGRLVQERTVYTDDSTPSFKQLDSTKTINYFDNQNRLIKKQHFNFNNEFFPIDTDEHIALPNNINEKNKSIWHLSGEIFFKYDSMGRKIEFYAPEVFWDSQNRYTWSYNENGKIEEYHSYNYNKIIWIKKYTYSDEYYQYTTTWYDDFGTPRHQNGKSWEYIHLLTSVLKLDGKGWIFEELEINEKGDTLNRTLTEYNQSGFISKKVRFSRDSNPEITHVFKYH
ncbi:hypothetical protein [Cognataquiflexum rubidum]|uniref:hypothetical protein n=1 Tax=Cognataquiflexum rubidum TaxID=2922273 RepID=UPI001F1410DA|nr:hypothetical protein [Cognataquiflexum rubidum]MCH6233925.1 hypothetical protein [Cognataquiflexum rubidum]